MPVRIYDIAKKLGIESKEVLVKAKELGITAARVPSSSLDKITAEYLEEQLRSVLPPPAAPAPPAPTPPPLPPAEPVIASSPATTLEVPPPVEEKVELPAAPVVTEPVPAPVAAPAPEPAPAAEPPPVTPPPLPVEVKAPEPVPPAPQVVVVSTPPAPVEVPTPVAPVVEAPPAPVSTPPPAPAPEPVPVAAQAPAPVPPPPVAPAAPEAPPVAPPPPPPPPAPRLGEKVGFIQLPTKPKVGDKVGSVKLPPRPGGRPGEQRGRQPEPQRQGRPQQAGPGGRPQQQQFGPGGRPQQQQQFAPSRGGQPPRGAEPAQRVEDPRYVAPANAEVITMKPPIIVRDLAEKLKRRPYQLIADLIELKVLANVNQTIDEAVAQKLCAKYGFRFEIEKREKRAAVVHPQVREVELDVEDKPADLKPRAPVVTIMGHVDHGKTSLLDVIRKSNVVAGEAGGITQHIGAYTISVPHPDRKNQLAQITFLDTPGHAAFSAMRARGANVTDVVVLVVAANDGVMPQTLEALSHAKAAKVPILVAVNKVDHPNANPLRVRQQLQDKGLVPDEWGGDTIYVDVSALTKQGVDKLLEMILLQADLLELKANPNRRAKGNVIESGLSPGGPTATLLVRKGTLKVGDVVICGQYYGKVRALINEEGTRLKEAGPSVAVKMLGLNGVPEAGADFSVVEDEKAARAETEKRAEAARSGPAEPRPKVSLKDLFERLDASSEKVLKVVVKADTQGSVEAIVEALKKIESDKVSLEIIHSGVGTINESDVRLASASNAVILGFHTRVDNSAAELAKQEGVEIKLYAIIYEMIDQVKEAMAGLLEPITKETTIGAAEVRKVFELSKGGKVAGCMVASGRVVKGKARVVRRKNVIYEGIVQTLRRFQDEANEVRAGMECGIRIDGFDDFQTGDMIESYVVEKIAPKL